MSTRTGTGGPESGDFDHYWHDILTGNQVPVGLTRIFRHMPSPPRCKSCSVPFSGPYAPILRMLRFRPWPLNQQLCRWCYQGLGKRRGGAEIPVSVLFSDVRGSTSLAEQMTSGEFTALMGRFYATVFAAVDAHDGIVDHLVGDGVMAMWTPAVGGENHPRLALEAGRQLVSDLVSDPILSGSLEAGVGVHTGEAWVGVVGETGAHDFTVLGDVPNTVSRLGSAVGQGELAVSREMAEATGVNVESAELRSLALKGKSEPVSAWIERAFD